jgi:type IV secretory pathway VirB2 component (pilin)
MSGAVAYAVWGTLALVAAALWARTHQPGAASARPTVVLQRLAQGPVTRVVLVVGWAWLGWHLFAR